MKTLKYKLGEKYSKEGCVLALGFFDGVHLGHRMIITNAKREARLRGVPSAVFTFAYGSSLKGASAMIYTEDEREELLSSLGIDFCFIADFDELRTLAAEDFVKRTVLSDIGASLVLAGYDYRFGHLGKGNAELLSLLMKNAGAEALILDAFCSNGVPVSSTRVRTSLENGDVKTAGAMLGKPYFLKGRVEHGRGDGHGLGFPTVNISVPQNRAHLKYGVYLTAVKIGEKLYTGLTNAGKCPTLGKRDYHTETHILDFEDSVYGQTAVLYFFDFLREEKNFSSKEELVLQIEKDCADALKIKENIKWQEIGLV